MASKRMITRILALVLCLSLALMGGAFAEGKHLNGALYWFGSSLDPATEWDGWTTCRAGITETLVTVNEKFNAQAIEDNEAGWKTLEEAGVTAMRFNPELFAAMKDILDPGNRYPNIFG